MSRLQQTRSGLSALRLLLLTRDESGVLVTPPAVLAAKNWFDTLK